MKLISEFVGGYRDLSKAELEGLLKIYGGEITGETDKLLLFESGNPYKITRRVAFSKRIGSIVEEDHLEIPSNKSYAIRELRGPSRKSMIEEVAKRIKGRVDLTRPDVLFYVYNLDEPIVTQTIYERRMNELLDHRYGTRPLNHPSSISPILARGMINIAGLKEGDTFVDPFAGTGTYLIEGFRMGINSYGIDRSWKMVEGGNKNLKHFGFPENIKQGDFADIASFNNLSAVVTDPPYGRGAKIFSQSRDSLYARFFSLASRTQWRKVFCVPSNQLLTLAEDYLQVSVAGMIRVHSSLTRYVVVSK